MGKYWTHKTNSVDEINANDFNRAFDKIYDDMSESMDAEAVREANEAIRVSNETARETAENARAAAETERASAEEIRNETFDGYIAEINDIIEDAPVLTVNGRGGVVTLTKSDVGLSNVDNTSDMNKPISTAVQTELNKKSNRTYCTCSTSSGISAKVADLSSGDFELKTGVSVDVRFTYTNSAGAPTLNVNDTGAKAIKMYSSTAPSTYMWQAGTVVSFTYDGTYWLMQNGTQATTTYYGVTKLSSSTSSTSTSIAATPSAVKAAYDLANAAIPQTQKAAANGVASLDADGKIPAEQLPDNGLQAAIDAKPGKKMTQGETVNVTQTETATVGAGAEIFNNTGLREYDGEGNAYGNVAAGSYSHAEGLGVTVTESYSHGEGLRTYVSGSASHAEGGTTHASGAFSHAEGYGSKAEGHCAHAEGELTTAGGNWSHAEGRLTVASVLYSHAEGTQSEANGYATHAEGRETNASAHYSHAEGYGTTASGECSHAENQNTTASGWASHAEGFGTIASGNCQHAGGILNAESSGSLFILGNGTDEENRSNAFRVDKNGEVQAAGQYNTTGADYAERFEWQDGNPENEDRRGLFVTLDGEKIRLAMASDDYILGVISATPSVVGDAQEDWWRGKYLRDCFGVLLTETVTVEEHEDEVTGETVPEHEEERYILNPEYDAEEEYISRDARPEWAMVGMVGKLIVVDDGTCEVNGYCKAADGGIATKAENGYLVMKRVDENHVKILLK